MAKLSPRTKLKIVRESVKDPRKTAREVQKAVGAEARTVSLRTIQRCLVDGGRICYRPIKAPQLTKIHKTRRLCWENERLSMSFEESQEVSSFGIDF